MSASSPFARWVYRDVRFDIANVDVAVPHEFIGVNPNAIRWTVLALEGAATIYRPLDGSGRENDTANIFLQASAPARARLLLSVEHPE